jgi:hypothetical protein
MKRPLLAILGSVIVVLASTLTYAGAQRKTGDGTVRLARATLRATVEAIMIDRRSKCMNAIGSQSFCDCLNGSLPLAADFQTYIRITTATSDAQLTPADRQIADAILVARDRCVATVFPTKK